MQSFLFGINMRKALQSVRQIRSALWYRKDNVLSSLVRREHFSTDISRGCLCKLSYNGGIIRHSQPYYMSSRAMFADVATATNGGIWSYEEFFLCTFCEYFNHMFLKLLAFDLVDSIIVETRGGPLVKYERRIAEGELLDGDACQVSSNTLVLKYNSVFCD